MALPEPAPAERSRRRWLPAAVALVVGLVLLEAGATSDPYIVPDGEALFLSHCATCHGRSGRGDGPDGFLFTPKPRDLHDGFLERYPERELVRRILDGATLALLFDPAALRTRAHETEVLVAHLDAIAKGDWPLITLGQRLYMTRCQSCHGVFGHAEPGSPDAPGNPPRDLSSETFRRSLSDAELRTAVRHGRHGMPPIPVLEDDADARALVAYVRALSPGFELYSRYCAVCHGDDGHPARVVAPARRPTVVFDREYLAHHDPDRLRIAVWHMLAEKKPMMPHFRGELSESGTRAIIEYLQRTK